MSSIVLVSCEQIGEASLYKELEMDEKVITVNEKSTAGFHKKI